MPPSLGQLRSSRYLIPKWRSRWNFSPPEMEDGGAEPTHGAIQQKLDRLAEAACLALPDQARAERVSDPVSPVKGARWAACSRAD